MPGRLYEPKTSGAAALLLRLRACILVAMSSAVVLAMPGVSIAACHIAVFTEKNKTVGESAGKVTLEVQLSGGAPTCEGTVHYKTVNDTATSPSDYTFKEGELRFVAGDDRKEPIEIPIKNDTVFEATERFKVQLSPGATPGSIQPESTPAVVQISDNDPSPSPSPSPTATKTKSPSPSPTSTPTATSTPTSAPTPSPTPTETQTPSETPTPFPTTTDTGVAAPEGSSGGGSNAGAIAAVVGAVVLLGGAGFLWMWRRRSGFG